MNRFELYFVSDRFIIHDSKYKKNIASLKEIREAETLCDDLNKREETQYHIQK